MGPLYFGAEAPRIRPTTPVVEQLEIGWTQLSCAWNRAYELQSGILDEKATLAARVFINQCLAAEAIDEQFADQQAQLTNYMENV